MIVAYIVSYLLERDESTARDIADKLLYSDWHHFVGPLLLLPKIVFLIHVPF